jgi:1-acyl-sn-glycerol-3-phosphate acyltransferase
MIEAAHHPVFEKFLGAYLRIHMRLIFRHVKIHSTFKDNGSPVLLIGNHFSWWDGFIARHVNINVFKRQLHLMMEEEQLAKRRFLSRLGAFSIKKNSRSAVESLNYAASVLNDPGKLLVVFPQGRFQSLHQHPLTFEKGWFRIIQKAQPDIQIVFMAALTDYFSSPRPGLDIYLESATPDNQYIPSAESNPDHHIAPLPVQDIHKNHLLSDAKAIETAFNAFHKKAIGLQNIGI